jgi:glycerol-3-phosphate dehydrogenase (NAD(P)+)
MEKGKSVSVLGGGSWATAIVKILQNNVEEIHWWMRNEEKVEYVKQYRRNPSYLQSIDLDTNRVKPSSNLEEVIERSDVIIFAIPSAFLADTFEEKQIPSLADKTIFSAIKGIVPEYHAIPARYIHKQFGTPYEQIGIISGPCHAEEVALERLSYLTIACPDQVKAAALAERMSCRYIQTKVSDDLFGTELSAVLKNVFSIASGICHGLGYGDNFQAVLISNAIREIERFVDAVNPVHRDVKSSAYLGDLLVTAYSPYSRNRTFGNMIGKGYSVRAAHMEMNMVAEGYYAVKSIVKINEKFQVDIPITDAVYRILYEKMSPLIEMKLLTDKLD